MDSLHSSATLISIPQLRHRLGSLSSRLNRGVEQGLVGTKVSRYIAVPFMLGHGESGCLGIPGKCDLLCKVLILWNICFFYPVDSFSSLMMRVSLRCYDFHPID